MENTPPTQAELDAWNAFNENHGYLRDYIARRVITEVERLTKEVEELRKDKETSDLLIKGLEGNLAACEQENEKLRSLINPFDIGTTFARRSGKVRYEKT